jgi:hypothetical protein
MKTSEMFEITSGQRTRGKTKVLVVLLVQSSVTQLKMLNAWDVHLKSETADNVYQLKELVFENRRVTTSEVADVLGALFNSVQSLRSSFFWNVTHCRFVVSCQHFGTTYQSMEIGQN